MGSCVSKQVTLDTDSTPTSRIPCTQPLVISIDSRVVRLLHKGTSTWFNYSIHDLWKVGRDGNVLYFSSAKDTQISYECKNVQEATFFVDVILYIQAQYPPNSILSEVVMPDYSLLHFN